MNSKRPKNWYEPGRPMFTRRTPVIVKPNTQLQPLPEERAKYEAQAMLENYILPMFNLPQIEEVRLQIINSRFFSICPYPFNTGYPVFFSYTIMLILCLTISEIEQIAPDYGLHVQKNKAGRYWEIRKKAV